MPDHSALWLPAKRSSFAVGSNTYTRPQPDEIVVRNRAVAVNPVDRLLPTIGDFVFPWLQYPVVPGSDLAGEVVEVGSKVTRFLVGDRVLGHSLGVEKGRSASAEGAFQSFTIVLEHMASPLPAALSFEEAAVLPLGLSTAACGLFQRDFIALRPPVTHPGPINETILVWGGSTSVGTMRFNSHGRLAMTWSQRPPATTSSMSRTWARAPLLTTGVPMQSASSPPFYRDGVSQE